MKTVAQHLCSLPDGYRQRAFSNAEPEMLSNLVDSPARALARAFSWRESPEGPDFWVQVYFHLAEIPLPPLLEVTFSLN